MFFVDESEGHLREEGERRGQRRKGSGSEIAEKELEEHGHDAFF